MLWGRDTAGRRREGAKNPFTRSISVSWRNGMSVADRPMGKDPLGLSTKHENNPGSKAEAALKSRSNRSDSL